MEQCCTSDVDSEDGGLWVPMIRATHYKGTSVYHHSKEGENGLCVCTRFSANPLDTTLNSCHYQFKLKKTHKNAYLPNMRNFAIYICFTCSHFPKLQKIK